MTQDECGAFEKIGREFKNCFGHITPEEALLAINSLGPLQARAASTSANVAPAATVQSEEVPMEVWHGERKVAIYKDCVLRVWGTNIESEMSDEPRTLQTVQDAIDWLYTAPQSSQPKEAEEAGENIRFDFINSDGQADSKVISHDEMRERYAEMYKAAYQHLTVEDKEK